VHQAQTPTFFLRAAEQDDASFVRLLYRSTRERELAMLPWSDAEKAAFCDMQFTLQSSGYGQAYPQAQHLIICDQSGQPVGRLIKAQLDHALLLVDISLIPACRGQGWGGALIVQMQHEAANTGLPMHLSVEKTNPAVRLYSRLGFRPFAEDEMRFRMAWSPAPTGAINAE